MYQNDAFYHFFKSVPLPYSVFTFPKEPASITRKNPALFFCNKMRADLNVAILEQYGFTKEKNAMICHVLIGRRFSVEQLQTLNDFQKCCHFSNIELIGTKLEFHNRMKELSQRLGMPVPFSPLSFYPPVDFEQLSQLWKSRKLWIIKAPALSRAREIRLASSATDEAPNIPYIIEEYISNPFLITGRKFDIRLYAVITSINPLVIYFHNEGLVLFAANEYNENGDISNLQMHLTNYEINKNSPKFKECEGINEKVENSKWSLAFLWQYFENQGINSTQLRQTIENAATSALIAGMCAIRKEHLKNIKNHRKSSFEFVGVDILLDSNLTPYVLEINISPSMLGTSELDKKIKFEVGTDLYNIVRIFDVSAARPNECMGYFAVEQEYLNHKTKVLMNKKTRAQNVVAGELDPWDHPTFAEYTIIREFLDEQERKQGFHRTYPRKRNIDHFAKYFDNYIYEDIVLNQWLKMPRQRRFEVLMNDYDYYFFAMQNCYKLRDNPPPEFFATKKIELAHHKDPTPPRNPPKKEASSDGYSDEEDYYDPDSFGCNIQ